jgi:hypothetical protein
MLVYSQVMVTESLDSVDKVIWILPFLALLDTASTLYLDSLGRSSPPFVRGFFAAFFVTPDPMLTYSLVVVYVIAFLVFSFILSYMKNKLDSSEAVGKLVFLVLLAVIGYIYLRLTASFIVNFFYFPITSRGIDLQGITMVVYASTAFSLGYYIWHDVVAWVRSDGDQGP